MKFEIQITFISFIYTSTPNPFYKKNVYYLRIIIPYLFNYFSYKPRNI